MMHHKDEKSKLHMKDKADKRRKEKEKGLHYKRNNQMSWILQERKTNLTKLLGYGGSDDPCAQGSNVDRDKRGERFRIDRIPFAELPVCEHPPQSIRRI